LLATNPNYKIQGWRYFNVYGPCENHKGDQASPITKFTNQALDDNTIKIFKDSDKFKRDFICVDDIIRIKYETSKKSVSGIYNLGTGEPVSFKQVAQFISKKFNATMEEIDFPENLKGQYQEYTCADLNKLRTVIGSYRFISVDAFVNSL
jgi:ADP-L-glycero-D-manno-heptose 6-epimerase